MDGNADHTQTSANNQEPSIEEVVDRLQQQYGALQAYFFHFMSAKVDALKLPGRHLVLWIVIGGLGVVGLVTLMIVAVVLLCTGLATGLGLALGGSPWLGQVVVGLGIFVMFATAISLGCRSLHYRARTKKVQQYAERQFQQRAQFGHSVVERAHDPEV